MRVDAFDIAAVIGFVLLVTGIALIYIPVALIVAGTLILIAAIRGSQRTSGE
jgi:hypothetical protein